MVADVRHPLRVGGGKVDAAHGVDRHQPRLVEDLGHEARECGDNGAVAALVVTALCGFAVYIAKSLKMQNSLRTGASTQTASVEFTTFGAKYVFGAERLKIRESVSMPDTAIVDKGE